MHDDMTTLITLACFTEDRTDAEQRALLRVAVKADRSANRLTNSNRRRGSASRLTEMVVNTRVDGTVLIPKEYQRVVDQANEWDRWHLIGALSERLVAEAKA